MLYNYTQYVQSSIEVELDFCHHRSSGLWDEFNQMGGTRGKRAVMQRAEGFTGRRATSRRAFARGAASYSNDAGAAGGYGGGASAPASSPVAAVRHRRQAVAADSAARAELGLRGHQDLLDRTETTDTMASRVAMASQDRMDHKRRNDRKSSASTARLDHQDRQETLDRRGQMETPDCREKAHKAATSRAHQDHLVRQDHPDSQDNPEALGSQVHQDRSPKHPGRKAQQDPLDHRDHLDQMASQARAKDTRPARPVHQDLPEMPDHQPGGPGSDGEAGTKGGCDHCPPPRTAPGY
ncbi:COL-68 protein [Aphelenchoides avenae]|nr:COL-68 protein [Aphelenchus avenae]